MLPSIFGENLFDEFFNEPFAMVAPQGHNPLYGKHAKTLNISAAKALDKEENDNDGKYIRQERYAGSCSRSFYVGTDVDPAEVAAKFENGILSISVPKASRQLPAKSTVEIK